MGTPSSRSSRHTSRRLVGRFVFAGILGAGLVAGLATPGFADQVANLARELAALRGEVETLSQEVTAKQQETENEMRSLSRQKGEAEAELQREKLRIEKVRRVVAEKRAAIDELQKADIALRPTFDTAKEQVRAYVRGTLPFRLKERLSEIDKIEEQAKSGLLTPERALARLWSFMEDEFRLANENGVFKQTILLDGEEILAEVVRIGMVMLYFRTSDSVYGHAIKDATGKWTYARLTGKKHAENIETLFESFQKQIRNGYFQVPAGGALTAAP